ncbi:MAG: hypothetical protein GWP19_07845, partial [Planctomycetia bacterium]|nr:hypothetical protein [Planctomycetia bacterium]
DNDDYEKYRSYNWTNIKGYARNNKLGALHRLIMNCPNDKEIDHINNDSLDNQKLNLRICTHKENMQNVSKISKYRNSRKGNIITITIDRNIYIELKKYCDKKGMFIKGAIQFAIKEYLKNIKGE